jgi:hypothetical protein
MHPCTLARADVIGPNLPQTRAPKAASPHAPHRGKPSAEHRPAKPLSPRGEGLNTGRLGCGSWVGGNAETSALAPPLPQPLPRPLKPTTHPNEPPASANIACFLPLLAPAEERHPP